MWRFWQDRALLTPLVVGTVLRILPLAMWPYAPCVRDECTYRKIAERMAEGEGMTPSAGWLWAPGYPFLMSIHERLFGFASTIKGTQVAVAVLNALLLYTLAERLAGRKAAIAAVWLYVLHPVMVFYTVSMWSETIYTTALLAAILCLVKARDHALDRDASPWLATALTGAFGGACILFRGIATYMVPLWMLGVLWKRWTEPRAWAQALLIAGIAIAVVSPYSHYASTKWDTTIISDRTLGQMMWLGNNTFPPMSFDYGNGATSKRAVNRHSKGGRKPCAPMDEFIERDECQTREGMAWIKAHPQEFVERIPMRIAQMMTPHSLLTRHLRWGKWQGLPQWFDEVLITWGAVWSMVVMWGGAVGLALRGRGTGALVIALICAYHVAAIAMLAGLSRYRVPLEPLLMIYAGSLLTARPRLGEQPSWRVAVAVLVGLALAPFILWYLPAGWTWWARWSGS